MSTQATPTLSFKGIGASPGVAVGLAFLLDRKKVRTPKLRLNEDEVHTELMRLKTAVDLSDHQLLALWAAQCAEHVLHLFEESTDP